ncbi:MAG TPA: GAF domain-containing protein, partial [Longimicrobiaceae bacterium]|nr:GAF domain-containing protein [Longimicrobiaceae bacterium]
MRADTRVPVAGIVIDPRDGGWLSLGAPSRPEESVPAGTRPGDVASGPDLDRFIRLAALTLGADLAAVSLVHPDGLVYESCIRLPDLRATRTRRPLQGSLSRHTMDADQPLVIEDALTFPLDPDSPAVAEGIRTYVGVPLRSSGSEVPGTLSVAGYSPRTWAPAEIEVLRIIAGSIVAEIDLKSEIRRMERDQRERITSERRLALQQLALGLRHELNNALAGLILETELLSGAGTGYERYRESVASIQSQVWRIHEVLRRLDDVDVLPTKQYLDRGLMIDLSEPGLACTGTE